MPTRLKFRFWGSRSRNSPRSAQNFRSERRRARQTEFRGDGVEPHVVGPDSGIGRQTRRREKADVDIADPASEQGVALDEGENLAIDHDGHVRQGGERPQYDPALSKAPQADFADDVGGVCRRRPYRAGAPARRRARAGAQSTREASTSITRARGAASAPFRPPARSRPGAPAFARSLVRSALSAPRGPSPIFPSSLGD